MIKFLKIEFFIILFGLPFSPAAEQAFIQNDCKVLSIQKNITVDDTNTDALFWRISKPGYEDSYLLGTIHVKDPRILAVSPIIKNSLDETEIFLAESIFTPELEKQLSLQMFSANNSLLSLLDNHLQLKTEQILAMHNIPLDFIAILQPWAAYLIMNYPPGDGDFLDLKLQKIAKNKGKELAGLETLEEQVAIFTELAYSEQYELLFETICNYELIQKNLKQMIDLYLQADLNKLLRLNLQYSSSNHPIYQKLQKKLILDRNIMMSKRILDHLKKHSAFIAIGALHLPGKDGVVAKLKQAGFTLSPLKQL